MSKSLPFLRFYLKQFKPWRTAAVSSLLSLIILLPVWRGWFPPSRFEQDAWLSFMFVMAVCWFSSAFWTSPYVGGPTYVSALSILPARLQDIYRGFSLSRAVCGAALYAPPVLAFASVLPGSDERMRLAAIFALFVAFNGYIVFAALFRRLVLSLLLLTIPLSCWVFVILLPASNPLPLLLALAFAVICHRGGMYTVEATGILHIHHGIPASETAWRGGKTASDRGWKWVNRLPPLSRILLRRSRERYPRIISYAFVFLVALFVGYLPIPQRDLWFVFLAATILWTLPNQVLRHSLSLFSLPLRRKERRRIFHALHLPTLVATFLIAAFFWLDPDLHRLPAPSSLDAARELFLGPTVAGPPSSRVYFLWRLGGDVDMEEWSDKVGRVERKYADNQAETDQVIRGKREIERRLDKIDARMARPGQTTGQNPSAGRPATGNGARQGDLTAQRQALERSLQRQRRRLGRLARRYDAIRSELGRMYLGNDERDKAYAARQVSTYLWNGYGLADPSSGYSVETRGGEWEVRTSSLDGDLRRIRSRHRLLVILIGILISMWNLRVMLPGKRRAGLARLWENLFSWQAVLASLALGLATFGTVYAFLFFSSSRVSFGYYPELVPSWRGAVFYVVNEYYWQIAAGGLTACAALYRRNLQGFQHTETRFGKMRRMW